MKWSVWLPLAGGIGWAALLLPGAVYVPLGSDRTVDGSGHVTSSISHTLVQTNGHGILILVALPLMLSCLAGVALLVQALTGSPLAQWVAWICTGAVLAGALLGTITFLIGIFVMPTGALVSVACVIQHEQRSVPTGYRIQPPGE